MAKNKNNTNSASAGLFGNKKITRQEWQQMSLKRNQMAILNKDTPFIIKEAYKAARTNIVFSVAGSSNEDCKTIVLTSANAGEGKTTTSLNLAITFAQIGAKVLIIDGDLRKPRLHQYLGISRTNGLSTVLSNQKTFEESVYRDVRDGLDCLTAGSIPPNPAELLASEAMQNLLERLKTQYDYIFVDTPPITVVTDAVALSTHVTGIVLVVREGYTDHGSIEHSLTLLKFAKAKVLGFFANDTDPTSANYGTYRKTYSRRYGYKYGNKYGYKYGNYSNYGYQYTYSYGHTPLDDEIHSSDVLINDINTDESLDVDNLDTAYDNFEDLIDNSEKEPNDFE